MAAVVVNLDGGPMLDRCLDSLRDQSVAKVIVVDNGSAPDEVERLRRRSDVTLLESGSNRGFAAPANRGAREAGEAIRFVLFLNNDCVLETGYVPLCLTALLQDDALAAVQGVVLDGDGRLVDGLGITWTARLSALQRGRGEAPPSRDAHPFDVAGVSGTAALYRRDYFLAAGGFEETFFAWYEDADLALRLRRLGLRFACFPAARARHLGSATGRRDLATRWRLLFANRVRTLRRNLAPPAARAALRRILLSPGGLRDAAGELGWVRALAAFLSGFFAGGRGIDARVLASAPALTELPR